jgi:hypothetical protein
MLFAKPHAAAAEIKPNAAPPAPPEPQRILTHCPYCNCKLSPVEVKLERCLSCGAQFHQTAGTISRGQVSGSFIVGI